MKIFKYNNIFKSLFEKNFPQTMQLTLKVGILST